MDYLHLLRNLKKEFLEAGRTKYESIPFIFRLILTLFFIPLRIGFFFARGFYWLTWFFFKAMATPVDYLQSWLKKEKDGVAHATQAVLYLVCMPFIFYQQIVLAFTSFAFFFQWFGLMLSAYIMTLGAVKWQPVISDDKYDEVEITPIEETSIEE